GCLGLLLAAVLGTRDSTPIHGAAQSAGYWSEMLVNLTLTVPGIALLAGTALVLVGLGERRRRAGPRALNAASARSPACCAQYAPGRPRSPGTSRPASATGQPFPPRWRCAPASRSSACRSGRRRQDSRPGCDTRADRDPCRPSMPR